VIGVGLLLDTFIVRTITVPAVAVLMGDKNWWPSKTPRQAIEDARKRAMADEREQEVEWYDDDPTGPIRRHSPSDLDDGDDDLDDDGYARAVQTASRVTAAWRDE
jgi:putative drug exporter of the RND superfamily